MRVNFISVDSAWKWVGPIWRLLRLLHHWRTNIATDWRGVLACLQHHEHSERTLLGCTEKENRCGTTILGTTSSHCIFRHLYVLRVVKVTVSADTCTYGEYWSHCIFVSSYVQRSKSGFNYWIIQFGSRIQIEGQGSFG